MLDSAASCAALYAPRFSAASLYETKSCTTMRRTSHGGGNRKFLILERSSHLALLFSDSQHAKHVFFCISVFYVLGGKKWDFPSGARRSKGASHWENF